MCPRYRPRVTIVCISTDAGGCIREAGEQCATLPYNIYHKDAHNTCASDGSYQILKACASTSMLSILWQRIDYAIARYQNETRRLYEAPSDTLLTPIRHKPRDCTRPLSLAPSPELNAYRSLTVRPSELNVSRGAMWKCLRPLCGDSHESSLKYSRTHPVCSRFSCTR